MLLCRLGGYIARPSLFSFEFCFGEATQPVSEGQALCCSTTIIGTACTSVKDPAQETVMSIVHHSNVRCMKVFFVFHPVCEMLKKQIVRFASVPFPLCFKKSQCLT